MKPYTVAFTHAEVENGDAISVDHVDAETPEKAIQQALEARGLETDSDYLGDAVVFAGHITAEN